MKEMRSNAIEKLSGGNITPRAVESQAFLLILRQAGLQVISQAGLSWTIGESQAVLWEISQTGQQIIKWQSGDHKHQVVTTSNKW
jgi:t-SNARE complex subunit (syntaxin)